jgi:outer membrane protein assembly factor BamB
MGATGILNCLNAADGSRVWSRDTLADASAQNREWGDSCSPLVTAAHVIVSSGGANGWSLVAYDKATGEIAWHAGDAPSAYASPILATLAGIPQILIVNGNSVVAHGPADGHILWEHPWGDGNSICANPIVIGDNQVFLSTGYGYGCLLLEIERDAEGEIKVSEVWPLNRNMKFKFTNGVHRDGFVYGLDDGVLACLELKTGKRRWKSGRYGHGQVLLVDDLLLIQAESGEVVLVRPDPKKLAEVARYPALTEKTWNNPALSGPYLLVRNDKQAACLRLPTRE